MPDYTILYSKRDGLIRDGSEGHDSGGKVDTSEMGVVNVTLDPTDLDPSYVDSRGQPSFPNGYVLHYDGSTIRKATQAELAASPANRTADREARQDRELRETVKDAPAEALKWRALAQALANIDSRIKALAPTYQDRSAAQYLAFFRNAVDTDAAPASPRDNPGGGRP